MRHILSVLAGRRDTPKRTALAALRENAALALRLGRVEHALRCYRDLERLDDGDPNWSVRVAECYRRMAHLEGEVSALMRAADRFERRGFVREARALWSRIRIRDPENVAADDAVVRLDQSCDIGLDRLRSSLPPARQTQSPPPGPVLQSDVVPIGTAAQLEIPRQPRVPSLEALGGVSQVGRSLDGPSLVEPSVDRRALDESPSAVSSFPLVPLESAVVQRPCLSVGESAEATLLPREHKPASSSLLTPPPLEAARPRLVAMPIIAVTAESDSTGGPVAVARRASRSGSWREMAEEFEFLEPELLPFLEDIDSSW